MHRRVGEDGERDEKWEGEEGGERGRQNGREATQRATLLKIKIGEQHVGDSRDTHLPLVNQICFCVPC